MSRTTHRRGRYVKMAPALLLHISYLMLLSTVRSWIEEGAAEPVHLWLIHAAFLLLALILLFGADTLWRLRAGGRHAQA
jgi:lipopolysaccharide export system permease protein